MLPSIGSDGINFGGISLGTGAPGQLFGGGRSFNNNTLADDEGMWTPPLDDPVHYVQLSNLDKYFDAIKVSFLINAFREQSGF